RVHLRRVRAVEPGRVPGELGYGDVHPEADTEIRDPALAGDATGENLALPAARAEAAGDEHAVHGLELGLSLFERHSLRVEPAYADGAAVVDPRMLERLVHREVRVVELHVLADQGDLDLPRARGADALGQLEPFAELGLTGGQLELLADEPGEALGLERRRAEVEVREGGVGE